MVVMALSATSAKPRWIWASGDHSSSGLRLRAFHIISIWSFHMVLGSDSGSRGCTKAGSFVDPYRELASDSHARHSERFALHFHTMDSDVFDRQGRQIVQSRLNLEDTLP